MKQRTKKKNREWNVKRSLVLMQGLEQSCRLLIADSDREIVDRDSFGVKNSPRAIGAMVTTVVMCALYCEYALKTFHAFVKKDGIPPKGHKLLDLYESLEDDLPAIPQLGEVLLMEFKRDSALCDPRWLPNDVLETIKIGNTNFEDWRYGYPEGKGLEDGVPKALFAIGKGIEVICRRSYLSKQPPTLTKR